MVEPPRRNFPCFRLSFRLFRKASVMNPLCRENPGSSMIMAASGISPVEMYGTHSVVPGPDSLVKDFLSGPYAV